MTRREEAIARAQDRVYSAAMRNLPSRYEDEGSRIARDAEAGLLELYAEAFERGLAAATGLLRSQQPRERDR